MKTHLKTSLSSHMRIRTQIYYLYPEILNFYIS